MEYRPDSMVETIKARAEKAAKSGLITRREKMTFIKDYKMGIRGYTYFEK
jgi:arginine decarboxylase-like protein